MRSHSARLIVSAALCLLGLASALRAGDAASAASIVPADVELFMVVDDAAAWRRGPGGKLLESGGRALAEAGDLARAWKGLAAALDMDEGRAFDELLGRRLVFAQRSAKDPAATSPWVVVSLVSNETEALLRRRLRPAPRRVERGITVLALEDGRFWLATTGGKHNATVMLAPAAAPELFDDMLATLGRGIERSLLGSKMGEDLRSIQRGAGALLFAKRRDDDGRLVLIGVGAKRSQDGVEAGVLLRSGAIAEQVAGVQETSRAIFDSISKTSYFAAVEWSLPDLLGAMGIDLPALPLWPAFKNFEGMQWIGARRVYSVSPRDGGGLRGAIALEATDPKALAAPGDRLIAQMLKGMWGYQEGAAVDAATLDFEGVFPGAVREVNVSKSHAGKSLEPWLKDARLAWAYPSAEGESSGWWVIGLGSSLVESLTATLKDEANVGGAKHPWISMGVVRPAALAAAVRAAGWPIPPEMTHAFEVAQGVESFEWALMRSDGGSIRGQAKVRFGE